MARTRIWRGVLRAAGGLVLLVIVAIAVVLGWSETMLRQHSAARAEAVAVLTDSASVAEGARLVKVHGCIGCHRPGLGGNLLFDEPLIARVVAPNLTVSIATQSTADLVTAIRMGVHADGRTMMVMPSQAFAPLTDQDLGSMLGYLKSLPRTVGFAPDVSVGPIGRIGLVAGKFKTSLSLVRDAKPPPEAADATARLGRYLARTACAQCHGADLRGAEHPEGTAPDLRIAAAYSAVDFEHLMRSGIGVGGRNLGVMTAWAKTHFTSLTDAEVAALYRYLHAMAD